MSSRGLDRQEACSFGDYGAIDPADLGMGRFQGSSFPGGLRCDYQSFTWLDRTAEPDFKLRRQRFFATHEPDVCHRIIK